MKTVLFFLLGFFASAKAQEIVISPQVATEEIINFDKKSTFIIWEIFEFEITDTPTPLEIFKGEAVLFGAVIKNGRMKITAGNFKIEDVFVQLILDRETGKQYLRLKFKYGVLPKGSKLRFGSSAVFLFK